MLVQKDALIFEFGENATFKCESGDIYFEQDRDMRSFDLTCQTNGRWNAPFEWPKGPSINDIHKIYGIRVPPSPPLFGI